MFINKNRQNVNMLDEKDELIVEELRKDSRMSTVDIARKTGLPRVTVHERIRKLKEKGVIKRFTVVLDNSKVGRPTTAFVLVSYDPHQEVTQRKLAEKLAKLDGVYEVHILAGEWDLLLKVRADSVEGVGKLVVDKLREIGGIGKTVTLTCFSSVKEEL
ncbi:Lrp/AsnC family transcriptional regulator [Candidatus Micrarchaeota archaeon]|nr:Lrp/AsnC family transcriptional regulator [Candidatus Micrarchaeota archaeon]